MTRDELLQGLKDGRTELLEAIEGLTEAEATAPDPNGGWTLKDVLAHLAVWEAEVLKALGQVRMGKRPTINDVSDAEVDRQNARWQKETAGRPFDKVLEDLYGARTQTLKVVAQLPDEALNDRDRYEWLRGETLAAFIASETFEHARDHLHEIVARRKPRAGSE